MENEKLKYNRRSIRLNGYDYSSSGAYFVTICTKQHRCILGTISNGTMSLNSAGEIVSQTWLSLADRYSNLALDEWVVMPNHIHGILLLNGAAGGDLLQRIKKPLGGLVGAFKTISSKRINGNLDIRCQQIWQRNYWEHIVRTEESMNQIREYIFSNPAKWEQDRLYVPV